MSNANCKVSMNFQLQPDHGQVQLGQTAVSSKILATTTAVCNKTKAYNNLTSRKISLKNFKLLKLKIVLMMGRSGVTFGGKFLVKLGKYTSLIGPLNFPSPQKCIKKCLVVFF